MYAVSVTFPCVAYKLQELIYTASVITEAQLIFSSFHCTSPSHRHIVWVEICQENHKMFSFQNPSAEQWLTACHGRRHLNCLIMDLGYDRLSHPERMMSCVSWGTITLPSCTAVCVGLHSDWLHVCFAALVKVVHHSKISCSWALSRTAGTTVRHKKSVCFKWTACCPL